MTSHEFVVSTKLWLGAINEQDSKILRKAGFGMYGRHHAIRDIIYEAANAARLRPSKEAAIDASGQRPADVFLPDWSRGQPLAIDVTVTHFSQTSPHFNAELGYSASERAAQAKVTTKERLYKDQCTAQNVDFMAAAICSYGGWLPEGTAFIKRLAACLADSTGQDRSTVISNLWQRLSVALWRGNSWIVLQHHPHTTLGRWDLPPS